MTSLDTVDLEGNNSALDHIPDHFIVQFSNSVALIQTEKILPNISLGLYSCSVSTTVADLAQQAANWDRDVHKWDFMTFILLLGCHHTC